MKKYNKCIAIVTMLLMLAFMPTSTLATEILDGDNVIIYGDNNNEDDMHNAGFKLHVVDVKGNPIKNAEFTVFNDELGYLQFTTSNGIYQYTINGFYSNVKSDGDGYIQVAGINNGEYSIEYTQNIEKYVLSEKTSISVENNTPDKTITLQLGPNKTDDTQNSNYNNNHEQTITEYGSLELNLSTQNGEPIKNMELNILDPNGNKLGFTGDTGVYRCIKGGASTISTNGNGNIFIGDIKEGVYSIKQINTLKGISNNNYVNNFNIKAGKTTKLSDKLNSALGSFKINIFKEEDQKPLNGGRYVIKTKEGNPLSFVGDNGKFKFLLNNGTQELSPKDGVIELNEIPIGNYVVEEVANPVGFSKNDNVEISVKENEQETIDIYSKIATGSIEVSFVDSKTKEPINKCEIEISAKDGKNIYVVKKSDGIYNFSSKETKEKIFSNKTNKILITGIPVGEYKVKQTKVSDGYMLNKHDSTQEIVEKSITKYSIECPKSNAAISLMDERGKPVSDIKVTIRDHKGKRVLSEKTNSNGKLLIGSIPAGKYNYKIKDLDSPYMNKVYEGTLTIDGNGNIDGVGDQILEKNKVVIKTNNIEGAIFKIVNKNNKVEGFEVTTDVNGVAEFDELDDGEYEVSQIDAPSGYALSKQIIPVSINRETQEPIDLDIQLDEISDDADETETENQTDASENKKLIIGVVAGLILICGISAWYAVKKKEKEERVKDEILSTKKENVNAANVDNDTAELQDKNNYEIQKNNDQEIQHKNNNNDNGEEITDFITDIKIDNNVITDDNLIDPYEESK